MSAFTKLLKRYQINWIEISIICLSAVIGFSLIHVGTFSDEADYILGGCLVAEGHIPYKDFFDHHFPIPFYPAAFVSMFVGCRIFVMRYLVIFAQIFALFLGWRYTKNKYLLYLIPLYFLVAPYYYAHMYISEAFMDLGLMLLLPVVFSKKNSSVISYVMYGGGLLLLANANQLGMLFAGLFFLYFLLSSGLDKKKVVALSILSTVPLIVILIVQNNIAEFYQYAIRFNTDIYSRYLKGTMSNPVDMLISLIMELRDRFMALTDSLLDKEKFMSTKLFAYLLETIFILSILYYVLKSHSGKFIKIILILVSIFSLIRYENGPFHILPFIVVSIYILSDLFRSVKLPISLKVIMIVLYVLAFRIYFGEMPKDLKKTVNFQARPFDTVILEHTSPGDKILIIPNDSISYITTGRRPGSYFESYWPWVSEIPGADKRVMNDLKKNNVKLVYYKSNDYIWGHKVTDYTHTIWDYLKKNYDILPVTEDIPGYVFIKK